MEFVRPKRGKKRRRKRCDFANKNRDQIKLEVKHFKSKNKPTKRINSIKKEKVTTTMEANAFWENYKAAHEWQKRHTTTWWKTRCMALEHENHVLKETIRNFSSVQRYDNNATTIDKQDIMSRTCHYQDIESNDAINEDESNIEDNFVFEMNEDMIGFLTQSARHKIEMKKKRDSETLCSSDGTDCAEFGRNTAGLIHDRNEDAKLLYGETSSRILAMETALQASIEKYVDKSKPQYWPNIPLKL